VTRKSIHLFMWGYQEHFTIAIRRLTEDVLKQIRAAEEVQVFLVGVRSPGTGAAHPVCVEPENGMWPLALFSGIEAEVERIYQEHPGHQMFYTHAETMRDKPENIRRISVRDSVQQRLEGYDAENRVFSFVTGVVPVGGYHLATVIQIPQSTFDAYPELTGQTWERAPYTFGFLRCCLQQIGEEACRELMTPEPGRSLGLDERSAEEIARRAAKTFMRHIASLVEPQYMGADLWALLNQVAALRYEGRDGGGSVVLVSSAADAEFHIEFAAPAPWREARWCRKLLEMSGPETPLIATASEILGVGRRSETANGRHRVSIEFKGQHDWELLSDTQLLLRVQAGAPRLPLAAVHPERFRQTLERLFPGTSSEARALLADVLVRQSARPHGSLTVIADDAAEEAERLSLQSMSIQSRTVTEALLASASRIDGALLIDPDGVCHAIGVVLDGPAHDGCTPARGARYNSALRYVTGSKMSRLAIVVSDDHTVDVLPLHRARISAKKLEDVVEQLERSTGDDYHKPRLYLSDHRFYLNQMLCDRVNRAIERIEAEPLELGEIRLSTAAFTPNPAFDESYLY
jgi:hypothetical protein